MSITAAAIAAGAALHSARKANKANKAEAEKNRQFQGGMSGTSYQRAVEDMKAAGINPMLSSKVGGASTPAGSVPTIQEEEAPAVNSAMAARRSSLEAQILSNQAANIEADSDLKRANAEEARSRIPGNQGVPGVQTSTIESNTASAAEARARIENMAVGLEKIKQETANLKSENERIQRSTQYIQEQIESANIDQRTGKMMQQMLALQIKGQRWENVITQNSADMSATQREALQLSMPKLRYLCRSW